ncbi:hypothetical protein [Pseudomonas sp. PGPR81]|uniref:hypothetical protein n=1 Tax=Pseudomonas sp. PGPR81 TaxID=2913477 RepID=UPI001EDAB801|nr:hypothetical protein [Pseudomonas sp. PGPR81]
MAIPLKERVKLDQIIGRIQSGKFDANDVDNLLIKLRPYAERNSVFFEVANYVAHSDARDRGLAQQSISAFVDSIRFFTEYTAARRQLEIDEPFPSYVYRLFLSQALLVDEHELKARHRMSRSSLIKKIESNFTLDKKKGTCSIKGKFGVELREALSYVVGFIHSRPAFHVQDFHRGLLDLMGVQGVVFDEGAWSAQADKISLAVLCLVSNTEYVLPGGESAHCELSTENHFRLISGMRRLPTGAVTSEPTSFGTLTIIGKAELTGDSRGTLKVAFPLITTDLDPRDHCDHRLFSSGPAPESWGDCEAEIIDFARDMSLTADFRLVRTDSLI